MGFHSKKLEFAHSVHELRSVWISVSFLATIITSSATNFTGSSRLFPSACVGFPWDRSAAERSSMKMENNSGEADPPCVSPVVNSAVVRVTSPAVWTSSGTRKTTILLTRSM